MLSQSQEVLIALLRATVMVALAAGIVLVVMRVSQVRSPGVWRAATLAVLAVGWSFVPLSVELPWYAPAAPEAAPPASMPAESDPPSSDVLGERLSPADSAAPLASDPSPPARSDADAAQIATAPSPAAAPQASNESAVVAEHAQDKRPAAAGLPAVVAAVLVALWLAGMVAIVARAAVAYIAFVRRLSRSADGSTPPEWQDEWAAVQANAGVASAIALRVTDEIGPVLCRMPRAYALLVPQELWRRLEPAQRRAVLEHELAHYLRRDIWKSLAARVLALPHWFNPAAWWAVRRFDAAAEWACDARVCPDREAAVGYARALLALVEGQSSVPAVFSPAAHGPTLAERIRRVLAEPRREDSIMKRALLLLVVVAVAVAAFVEIELVAREAEQASQSEAVALAEAERSTAKAAASEGTSQPPAEKKADTSAIDRSLLRYDGKSFDEWKLEWRTELNPARRQEAIEAFATFAKNGYGREAVEAIVEVMRSYDLDILRVGKTPEVKLIERSVYALNYELAPEDTLPVLVNELYRDSSGGQRFAIEALDLLVGRSPGTVESLEPVLEAVRNTCLIGDESVVRRALELLRKIAKDEQVFVDTAATLLTSEDPGIVEAAASVLTPDDPQHFDGRPMPPSKKFFVPEFVELLKSDNSSIRDIGVQSLGRLGPQSAPAISALREIALGGDADRQAATAAIANVGGEAIPVLIDLVRDSPELGRAAVAGLSLRPEVVAKHPANPDVIQLLTDAVDGKFTTSQPGDISSDEDLQLRLASIQLLGRVLENAGRDGMSDAHQRALEALRRAIIGSSSAIVRDTATSAWPAFIAEVPMR